MLELTWLELPLHYTETDVLHKVLINIPTQTQIHVKIVILSTTLSLSNLLSLSPSAANSASFSANFRRKACSTCLPWKSIWSNSALVSAIESVKCKFSLLNAQILSLISINNSFNHSQRVTPSCHSQNVQPPSYRNTTG